MDPSTFRLITPVWFEKSNETELSLYSTEINKQDNSSSSPQCLTDQIQAQKPALPESGLSIDRNITHINTGR